MAEEEQRPYSSWMLERIIIGDVVRLRFGVSTIGRHPTSVLRITNSTFVSRNHGEIEVFDDDQRVEIRDKKSINGIYVNETLLRNESKLLKAGDRIGFGVSINEDENEIDLTDPIYVLRYAPMPRAIGANKLTTSSANRNVSDKAIDPQPTAFIQPAPKLPLPIVLVKPEQPSASVVVDKVSTCSSDAEKEKLDVLKSSELPLNRSHTDQQPAVKLPKTLIISDVLIQNATNTDLPKITAVHSNVTDIQEIADAVNNNSAAKNRTEVHVPIITDVKKECIQTTSETIESIFGKPDDVILDKMIDINPYLYKALNNQIPQTTNMSANVRRPLQHGDSIVISDDDDDEAESIGKLNVNASQQQDVASKEINSNFTTGTATDSVKNIDCNNEVDYIGESDDEDIPFSQAIYNDMQADLARNDVVDVVDDDNEVIGSLIEDDDKSNKKVVLIKREPLDKQASTVNNKKLLESSCWIISDDDDYDEEFEMKVSDWTNKLFSQSFSQKNQSQIYETAVESGKEEDSDKNNKLGNQVNDADDEHYHDNYDDELNERFLKDLYKDGENGVNQMIDDIFETLKDKITDDKKQDEAVENGEQQKELEREASDPQSNKNHQKQSEAHAVDSRKVGATKAQELAQSSTTFVAANIATDDSPIVRAKQKKKKCNISSSEDEQQSEEEQATNEKDDMMKAFIPIEQATTSATAAKKGPQIVDAPKLPRHRGKKRGVSAAPSNQNQKKIKYSSPTKLKRTQQIFKNESYVSDLKRKWMEKPSRVKKHDKEKINTRKERLKELSEKQSKTSELRAVERKTSTERVQHAQNDSAKKVKVKVTQNNRGAFLTKELEKNDFTTAKTQAKQTEKTRKTSGTDVIVATVKSKINNTAAETTKSGDGNKISRSLSADQKDSFSKQLCEADQLLLRKRKQSCDVAPFATTTASRAQRTTNKITFASMQKNFIETNMNQERLERIGTMRSCLTQSETDESKPKRKKKCVRFNDTPIIHYIERNPNAVRKVDQKDIMPLSTCNDRRYMITRRYPILNCTDKIISLILMWSNEWYINRNAEVDAAGDIIYPVPNKFASFEHYKNIMVPLMRLEFLCRLERDYKLTEKKDCFKVTLDYVTRNKDRLMLCTKYAVQSNASVADATKFDLVILDFGSKNLVNTFAFVSANRKGAGSYTIIFELNSENYSVENFKTIKEIKVRPVIDNVRVEFGAFNAIYQLECTPLFNKVLDPLELLQDKPVSPKTKLQYRGYDKLQDNQRDVVLNTYSKIIDETTPSITLIKGPPGTGKSTVITNLALQSLYGAEVRALDRKILICAQSNGAVDVIAGKLLQIRQFMRNPEIMFRLVRYGNFERMHPKVQPISLQRLVERDQLQKLMARNKNIMSESRDGLKQQMLELEAEIAEMQTRNIRDTVEEDGLFEKQRQLKIMHNIINESMRPEDERSIYTSYLSNAHIVCATLSSCVKLSQYVNYFDVCIIDEATQCTEPWTLLPLKFGINSLVLVGDTQQLPATVLSKKAYDFGLGLSMFTRIERCLEKAASDGIVSTASVNDIIYSLNTQYRMHPEICKWPNSYFYKNELISAVTTIQLKTPIKPFCILNLEYAQNAHCSNGKIKNNLEAEFVAKLLKALDGYIPTNYNSYGVITPYAHQCTALIEAVKTTGLTNVKVNTIDSYQGIEKDVIVISNARTNGIGFLSNYQRLNVALTRPRKCLILCGNFKCLKSVPAWRSLLNNARERNLLYDISDEDVLDIHKNVIEKIKR